MSGFIESADLERILGWLKNVTPDSLPVNLVRSFVIGDARGHLGDPNGLLLPGQSTQFRQGCPEGSWSILNSGTSQAPVIVAIRKLQRNMNLAETWSHNLANQFPEL